MAIAQNVELLTPAEVRPFVRERAGIPYSVFRRLSDAGLAPPARKYNLRVVRWSRAEIEDWVAQGCPGAKRRR